MDARRLARWLAPALDEGGLSDGLAHALRSLVLDGRVVPGGRVPAERALAAALGVSRATVTIAYNRLRDEGFLTSRHGAGTTAAIPSTQPSRPDDAEAPANRLVDLTVAALPAPAELLGAAIAAATEELPRFLGGHGLDPAGLVELRRLVADGYTRRGLMTSPGQILITSGALHAWDLVLRCSAGHGGTVVTEQPTYPAIVDAALAHRTRVVPLPVDDGWDLEQLVRQSRPPAAVHLSFDGQNPTGSWADGETRQRVLGAFREPTIVAVDETMLEFHHTRVSTRVVAASTTAIVVHVGSLSKTFWAGLRVGWIRGPAPLIRRLTISRGGQDLAPPVLEQLIAIRLLEDAEGIVPPRRKLATQRRDAVLQAIAGHADSWRVRAPVAGLAVWVDLAGASSTALARAALRVGIRITPGTRFTVTGTHDSYLRVPLTLPVGTEHDVIAQLAGLAQSSSDVGQQRRRGPESSWAV